MFFFICFFLGGVRCFFVLDLPDLCEKIVPKFTPKKYQKADFLHIYRRSRYTYPGSQAGHLKIFGSWNCWWRFYAYFKIRRSFRKGHGRLGLPGDTYSISLEVLLFGTIFCFSWFMNEAPWICCVKEGLPSSSKSGSTMFWNGDVPTSRVVIHTHLEKIFEWAYFDP